MGLGWCSALKLLMLRDTIFLSPRCKWSFGRGLAMLF